MVDPNAICSDAIALKNYFSKKIHNFEQFVHVLGQVQAHKNYEMFKLGLLNVTTKNGNSFSYRIIIPIFSN
jgi:hypothetical protein